MLGSDALATLRVGMSSNWKKISPRSPSAPQDADGRTEVAVDVALDGVADGVTVALGVGDVT